MAKKSVLVVEDDRKSLYALSAVLEQHGFEVKGLDTAEGVEVDARKFNSAVIDLRLPQVPGTDFARRLRRDNPGIKIVFVTAYGASDMNKTELEGCVVLVKPLDVEELLKLI